MFEGKWPKTSTHFHRWRRMFQFISAANYMMKVGERKRQPEVKTYLFGETDSPGSVSVSNDSGIDEIDHFNASPGRQRSSSQISSPSSSQTDLTDIPFKVAVGRTYSTSSDFGDSSQCQFITSDEDSDIRAVGYQVHFLIVPKSKSFFSLIFDENAQTGAQSEVF